jgi:hypothetical protein
MVQVEQFQKNSWRYLSVGVGLNTASAAFTLANRYFLAYNLFKYVGMAPMASVIWPLVLSDTIFVTLFQMTNELYETNTELRQWMDKATNVKPFYAEWRVFKSIAGSPVARYVLAIVGSLEHAIVDDLLPWLLFIPNYAWSYIGAGYTLWSRASYIQRALTVLVPLVGGLLALLIVLQTLLFEGEHSFEAYKSIMDLETLPSIYTKIRLPNWVNKFLQRALNIMPLCHGAAACAPVYVWFANLFNLQRGTLFQDIKLFETHSAASIVKSMTVVLSTAFTFIATTIGTHYSEVREAKAYLAELTEVVIQ